MRDDWVAKIEKKDNSLFHNDLRSTLAEQSKSSALPRHNRAHALPHGVERVDTCEHIFRYIVADGLVVLIQGLDETKQSAFCLVSNLFRQFCRVFRRLKILKCVNNNFR